MGSSPIRVTKINTMAKDKNKEIEYKAEGERRKKLRKSKRLEKFTANREYKKRNTCRGCGEDPYCYCGSGDMPYDY